MNIEVPGVSNNYNMTNQYNGAVRSVNTAEKGSSLWTNSRQKYACLEVTSFEDSSLKLKRWIRYSI